MLGLQGGWAGPREPHIWLVATDGKSAPRPFIVSKEGESSPRWSPDGRVLSFLSPRPDVLRAQQQPSEPKPAVNMAESG